MLFSIFVYLLSLLLRGKKPDEPFCQKVKNFFRRGSTVIIIGVLLSSCGSLLKPTIENLKEEASGIGKEAATGVVAGLDTSRVDSLVNRLVAGAGSTLRAQLDSVSLDSIETELRSTINAVVSENLQEISTFLQDTNNLVPLERKLDVALQGLLTELNTAVDNTLSNAIPEALSARNQEIVLRFRNDFLGEEFRTLLSSAVNQGVGDLAQSQELDSLLNKLSVFIDNTSEKVEESSDGISKVVRNVAIGLIGVLVALSLFFFVLWFRKRSQAKQQRELLVNLTKAIDAIPSQQQYDNTIDYLQQKTSLAHKEEQKVLLDQVLQESSHEYANKRRYRDYAHRMLEQLHEIDQDGSLRAQLLTDSEDEGFRKYLLKDPKD
ncbi:MAG: hypothetical protein AAF840_01010 [Bacteroidota bacterium]